VKILITGGAGYLGSILTEKLLKKKNHVKIIDKLWYGKQSVKQFITNKNFSLIEGDIRNLETLIKEINDVDAVVHLGSIVGKPASEIDPKMSQVINYIATKNIAELCQNYKIKKFIFASTCSVYGSQKNKKLNESSKTNPLDFYSQQKLECEQAIKKLKTNYTILRFGTLYGLSHRMRFDLVINRFMIQSILEKTITVNGGSQMRPFLHVSDAADSIIFSLENNLQGTFNVTADNMSINDVATKIHDLTNCKINISKNEIDKRNYNVSSKKISKKGFIPKKSIEYAYNEIHKSVINKKFHNYKKPKYDNYEMLYSFKTI
jgi:nucleoside-diphosphate-sugar epimerase